jgi:7,8-dihydropterin-6-yl-methyl-4-(beta-D-ribofuranosyl)aminobenzene 5'-phosphate synthase
MRRRQFLTLGVVTAGAVALGGVMRVGGRLALAQRSAVPTVDRLVLTTAVDNIYDNFAKAGRMGTLMVQRTGVAYPVASGSQLLSEHGLAYHLESRRGPERKEILLDFALTERRLFNNYGVLKIDPAVADALILSHGHDDHFSGLLPLLRALQGRMKAEMTLYAGGEDTFCHRWEVRPDGRKIDRGQLDRTDLEARGVRVVLAKEPTVVAGHAFTSGQIARAMDFEKGLPAARLEVEAHDSACAAAHFSALQVEVTPGELVADTFQGEHATAYHVRDRGLVVITSCGHAGVINSVRQMQNATGIEKVHAIVGGFHLAPAPDEVIAKTVMAFQAIDPDYIIPAHCTGASTIMAVHREMPATLVMPSTGTRVIFGA